MWFGSLLTACVLACCVFSQKIVITNDDGWAVAQIRAQNDALKAAGFDVSRFAVFYKIPLTRVYTEGHLVCPCRESVRLGLFVCSTSAVNGALRVQLLSDRFSGDRFQCKRQYVEPLAYGTLSQTDPVLL